MSAFKPTATRCVRALVKGRVQGVFFRDSTRRQARRLNLTGYAINLADGRVEVLACGDSQAIESLIDWLHQGPDMAQVTGVQTEDCNDTPPPAFTIG